MRRLLLIAATLLVGLCLMTDFGYAQGKYRRRAEGEEPRRRPRRPVPEYVICGLLSLLPLYMIGRSSRRAWSE
jgi:hypothetical protein